MKRTFFNSKSKDKQYLVIGCGRFGSSVAKKMCQLGNEVMVIDKDEDSINNIAELVNHTAIVDVTEERDLKNVLFIINTSYFLLTYYYFSFWSFYILIFFSYINW